MTPLAVPRRDAAPGFTLPGVDGAPVSLHDYWYRSDLLLVCLDGPDCSACAGIAAELVPHRDEWESWGLATLVVTAGERPHALPVRQALDLNGDLRQRYAGLEAAVAVAFVERRGALMEGWSLRHPEPLDWREVAETARWLSVQEPECGACDVLPGWLD